MRPRSVILLVVTLLLVGFAALNWENLLAATPISFLFGSVEAPLGLVLLLVVASTTLLFLGFVAFLEAQARLERNRLNKEIERWRELAENAEASRIESLKGVIEAGFDDLYDRIQRPSAGARPAAPAPPPADDHPTAEDGDALAAPAESEEPHLG